MSRGDRGGTRTCATLAGNQAALMGPPRIMAGSYPMGASRPMKLLVSSSQRARWPADIHHALSPRTARAPPETTAGFWRRHRLAITQRR